MKPVIYHCQTSDGSSFEDWEEAERHQAILNLQDFADAHKFSYDVTPCCTSFIEAMVDNPVIIKKIFEPIYEASDIRDDFDIINLLDQIMKAP